MKIKTKKKLNLPELIQCKRDEGSKHYVTIESDDGVYEARLNNSHLMYVAKNNCERDKIFPEMHFDTTFTVEVEEELTEETQFDYLIELYKWNNGSAMAKWQNESIKGLRNNNIKNEYTEKIWALNNDELILIWSREHGIPESGVLEVSE